MILYLLCLHSSIFSDNIIIDEIFYSPNNINKIEYVGIDRFGSGTFYKDNESIDNELLIIELGAIGPRINWYGDYIAEIYIYGGTSAHHSYFYLFKYNILTPLIRSVIYVIPEMELILNSDDLVHINIRSLVSNKILQILKIEDLNGSVLSSKNLLDTVIITDSEIILSSNCEPCTYRILNEPILYKFRRLF